MVVLVVLLRGGAWPARVASFRSSRPQVERVPVHHESIGGPDYRIVELGRFLSEGVRS